MMNSTSLARNDLHQIYRQPRRAPGMLCVQARHHTGWRDKSPGKCAVVGLAGSAVRNLGFKFHKLPQIRKASCSSAVIDPSDSSATVVDVCLDENIEFGSRTALEAIRRDLEQDARMAIPAALNAVSLSTTGGCELSVLLCDDSNIQSLNKEWRQKDEATDVLSFPMDSSMQPPGYPLRMLGDLVISLTTAERQALSAGHSLGQEVRVLLVHGLLHLLGQDHEAGDVKAAEMVASEDAVMQQLGWGTQGGLIASAENGGGTAIPSRTSRQQQPQVNQPRKQRQSAPSSGIKLLACDMDGTLLDSNSRVLQSTVEALRAALAKGVTVILATGKARPAAISCMETVGLAGPDGVVSTHGPGVFLQGLAVHGMDGRLLPSPNLPAQVVMAAFEYANKHDVPLAAFLGDTCATLKMQTELQELHSRYFEPLPEVFPSLNALSRGPPVKKLLFMTNPDFVRTHLQPHWQVALEGSGAMTTMAVDNMLEIVPSEIHKWVGMKSLLQESGFAASQVMTLGDGSNDLQLVGNAGIGVAMGNAVDEVKDVASFVTASNDDDGVAFAIEKYLL